MQTLLESYHGVYVNITYDLSVEMVRGGFSKNISCKDEFIVEVPVSSECKCTSIRLLKHYQESRRYTKP
jgi:hypothetical protein